MGCEEAAGDTKQSVPDVQRHAAGVGQGLKEVLHQLGVKGADAIRGYVHVKAQVGPA